MKTYLNALIPEGLSRLLKYRQRFKALDYPGSFSVYRKYRKALDMSHLELIPASNRANLNVVVDVGANIGEWSTAIAQLTEARQIIAFEPVPQVFAELENHTRCYPQIQCINSAVGSTRGTVQMNVESLHKLSSVLQLQDEMRKIHGVQRTSQSQVTVPLTTLDEALKEQKEISLLKVDVQGYEVEVFTGAQQTLQRTRVILTEIVYTDYYEGDSQFDAVHKIITSLAPFKLYGISSPNCSSTGKPLWADAIYIRAD